MGGEKRPSSPPPGGGGGAGGARDGEGGVAARWRRNQDSRRAHRLAPASGVPGQGARHRKTRRPPPAGSSASRRPAATGAGTGSQNSHRRIPRAGPRTSRPHHGRVEARSATTPTDGGPPG